MSGAERRKEQRFIVNNVYLEAGEYQVPVVDISASAARVMGSVGDVSPPNQEDYHLVFESEAGTERYPVSAEVSRSTDYYVVVSYTAPRKDWELYIEKFDSVAQEGSLDDEPELVD